MVFHWFSPICNVSRLWLPLLLILLKKVRWNFVLLCLLHAFWSIKVTKKKTPGRPCQFSLNSTFLFCSSLLHAFKNGLRTSSVIFNEFSSTAPAESIYSALCYLCLQLWRMGLWLKIAAQCRKLFRTVYIHFHPIFNVSSLVFQMNSCGADKLSRYRLFDYLILYNHACNLFVFSFASFGGWTKQMVLSRHVCISWVDEGPAVAASAFLCCGS